MDKVLKALKLSAQPHQLYLVQLSSDLTNEKFLKIGVTSQTIQDRFQNLQHYEVEILEFIFFPTGIEARGYESMLKEQALDYSMRYTPQVEFDGKTECYKIKHLEDLKEVFKHIEEHSDTNILAELVRDLMDMQDKYEELKKKHRALELNYIQMTEQYWSKI